MTAILHMHTHFKCIFYETYCIFIHFSLKFAPEVHIDDMTVLAEVMTWHQAGEKPIAEPMLTKVTMSQQVSKCKSQ